jgi:hypothetical protein
MVPGATKLTLDPPITLGAPLALGSNRNARDPLTFSSNG